MPRAATSWRVSNSFAAFCKRTRGEQSDNVEPGSPESSRTAPPGEHQSTDRRRSAAFGQNSACKSIAHFSDAAPTRGHTAQMLARTNPGYVIGRQDYGTALDELRNLVGRCARTGYAALVGRVSAKATGRSTKLDLLGRTFAAVGNAIGPLTFCQAPSAKRTQAPAAV